jgi:hypothetical protein
MQLHKYIWHWQQYHKKDLYLEKVLNRFQVLSYKNCKKAEKKKASSVKESSVK